MLIVCGALVNGPYALITTAVSADLVGGAASQEPGVTLGAWSGPLSPGPLFPQPFPLPLACKDPQSPSESAIDRPFLSTPSPDTAFSRVSPSPILVLGAPFWFGSSLCSLPPGDSQEPEGQRKGTVYRHGHHRWHWVHRSVTSF